VRRRLFHWDAVTGPVETTILTEDGVFQVEDTTRQVVVRPDTWDVLGVHGEGYKVHQYSTWLLDTVANILDDSLSIGSAGLLKNGAVAWVQVEVPDSITTPEGVEFRPHLLACTSHDGSIATEFRRTVTNVVCDNTMAAARTENGQVYRVRHTRHSTARLADARDALAIVHTIADDFAAEVQDLCSTTVTDKQWTAFLDSLVPVTKEMSKRSQTMAESKRDEMMLLWNKDQRVSPWKGTAWGVVQAVNTHTHHIQTVRGAGRAERNMLRAVSGQVDALDKGTIDLLSKVLQDA
jgi:phage/plasmid-like protein (TIGR03299 family)